MLRINFYNSFIYFEGSRVSRYNQKKSLLCQDKKILYMRENIVMISFSIQQQQ